MFKSYFTLSSDLRCPTNSYALTSNTDGAALSKTEKEYVEIIYDDKADKWKVIVNQNVSEVSMQFFIEATTVGLAKAYHLITVNITETNLDLIN